MKLPTASKLPSGRWRIQVQIDGDRLSITADTKKECERKAVALKMGLERPQSRSTLILRDAVENYIAVKESVLSPSTLRAYRMYLRTRLQSVMNIEIYKLTNQNLQIAVAEDAKQVSAKTVRNAYSLVHATLEYYHIHIDDVTLPQVMRTDKGYLQLDEIPKFINAAHGDVAELPSLMALLMGMRRSEILGLCWDCVDLDRGKLTIKRALVEDSNNKWILKDTTKNETSQRTLDIDARILPLIKPTGKDRVVTLYPYSFEKRVPMICERAGITRTTPHGLRHTWAAWMRSLGVDESVIIKLGGWSKGYTLKSVYDYVFDRETDLVRQKVDDYFAHEMHTEN